MGSDHRSVSCHQGRTLFADSVIVHPHHPGRRRLAARYVALPVVEPPAFDVGLFNGNVADEIGVYCGRIVAENYHVGALAPF